MRYGLENEAGDALEKYPYRFRDFKADFPTISIRDDMEAVARAVPRVVAVAERGVEPAPSDPATRVVVAGPPVKSNGEWSETWTERDLTAEELADRKASADMMVNAERDRRVALGFPFAGKMFDSRVEDQKRINGAASLAHIALTLNGKQPGDLRWHGGAEDFGWIAQDNSIVTMDAPTVISFGALAARWESLHVFAARLLKDAEGGVPDDYADDKHWPDPTTFRG